MPAEMERPRIARATAVRWKDRILIHAMDQTGLGLARAGAPWIRLSGEATPGEIGAAVATALAAGRIGLPDTPGTGENVRAMVAAAGFRSYRAFARDALHC